jgi:hypothetical protein
LKDCQEKLLHRQLLGHKPHRHSVHYRKVLLRVQQERVKALEAQLNQIPAFGEIKEQANLCQHLLKLHPVSQNPAFGEIKEQANLCQHLLKLHLAKEQLHKDNPSIQWDQQAQGNQH